MTTKPLKHCFPNLLKANFRQCPILTKEKLKLKLTQTFVSTDSAMQTATYFLEPYKMSHLDDV
jgi:hypothetical protein